MLPRKIEEETMMTKPVQAVCGRRGLRDPQSPLLASFGSAFI